MNSVPALEARLSPELRFVLERSWLPPHDVPAPAISEALDWESVIRLVDRHRIPALVHESLRRWPCPGLPEAVLPALEQRNRGVRLQAMHHASTTLELLRSLTAQGVVALPLKGLFLSQRIYGDIGLRHAKDIDLMVREEHFEAAHALLLARGFHQHPPVPGLSPTPRQAAYLLRTHYHYEYTREEGTQVELHWRRQSWPPPQMRLFWEHTKAENFLGTTVHSLDDDMHLLFLCDHGAHHRWFRIKWLSDVAMLFQQRQEKDCTALLALAAQFDLERPLAQAALLVHWLYGLPLPAVFAHMIADDPAVCALAEDAVSAIAGPEEEGLMRVSVPRKVRFQWRLRKRPGWQEFRDRLLLSPYDFLTLPLPDSLFPLYYLLRPVLWIWRILRRPSPVTPPVR